MTCDRGEKSYGKGTIFCQDLEPFFYNLVPAIWVSQHSFWSLLTQPKAKLVPVPNLSLELQREAEPCQQWHPTFHSPGNNASPTVQG